jgi:acyl-homoserine-lactone acylase
MPSGRRCDAERLDALLTAVARLREAYGDWRVAWGKINRFQRVSDAEPQPFDDDQPSVPVAMGSARWGSLASFDWARPAQTKRRYGSFGNSFVAAVEFGPRIRATVISAGGESGHRDSPHFADQVERYAQVRFRDALFCPEDVRANAERIYHPGD